MIPLNNLSSRTKYEKNDFLNLTSPLNSDKIDWRITSIQDCISEYHGGMEKGDSDNKVIDIATDYDEESLLQVNPREKFKDARPVGFCN